MNVFSIADARNSKEFFEMDGKEVYATMNGRVFSVIDANPLIEKIENLTKEKTLLEESKTILERSNIEQRKRLKKLIVEIAECKERLEEESTKVLNLEKELNSLRKRDVDQVNDELEDGEPEYRVIVWLREHQALCNAVIAFSGAGLCLVFPEFAIPLLLAHGGCISLMHYISNK